MAAKAFVGTQGQDVKEEQRLREAHRVQPGKLGVRPPRRSQTHYDYKLPPPPTMITIHTIRPHPQASHPAEYTYAASAATRPPVFSPSTPRIPEQQVLPLPPPSMTAVQQPQTLSGRRPPLGPPRRSHSVMDYEPMPHHHRPSTRGMTLLDLPRELHYAIFDFLDPIDSTCFGLASKDLYAIHRRMRGTVPLSSRRDGPNELEWAWHLAGAPPVQRSVNVGLPSAENDSISLAKLRVRGQAYCRKCGVCRCELHKHIQSWMGEGFEYCSVRQKFGPVAPEGANSFCYMSTPRNPNRCGRHRVTRSRVVLQ